MAISRVVGRSPMANTSSPSRALMNVLLPLLYSPTITSRKSSSISSTSFARRSTSVRAPSTWRSASRARSTSRRSSATSSACWRERTCSTTGLETEEYRCQQDASDPAPAEEVPPNVHRGAHRRFLCALTSTSSCVSPGKRIRPILGLHASWQSFPNQNDNDYAADHRAPTCLPATAPWMPHLATSRAGPEHRLPAGRRGARRESAHHEFSRHGWRWVDERVLRARRLPSVSYTHLRAHETPEHLVCRLLLE